MSGYPQPVNFNFYPVLAPAVTEAAASPAGGGGAPGGDVVASVPPGDTAVVANDGAATPVVVPPPRYVQGNPTWSRPRRPVPTGNPVDRDQCIIL